MKGIMPKHLQLFLWIASHLLVLLFVYAAVSKLLDFEGFKTELAQSPLLSAYAGLMAPAVIIAELLFTLLLCINITRLIGLYLSFFLMIAFTVYIFLILNYSDFVPCSCGGIIEKLGWTEHMIFNMCFALLALAAIGITEKQKGTAIRMVVLRSTIPAFVVVGTVVGLFLSSEHIIKKENSFIRRFLPHPLSEEKTLDLGFDSYYFAGMAGKNIYLGNVTTPLVLTSVDTLLSSKTAFRVHPDNTDHQFRNIQITVQSPYYYVFDGNVPVIYRGELGDSNTYTISIDDCYFSQLQVIDSVSFAFRARSSLTGSQVLGILRLNSEPRVSLNHELLEKQVDGMFDTDGQLLRDDPSEELIYIYAYRNEILVIDRELNLLRRLQTIDTTSRAQVTVLSLSDGSHVLAAPPLQVNKASYVHNGILFNQSALMGKYELREVWKQASVIDMYHTDKQGYPGSFYIYHRGKGKMSRMLVTDTHLYVLRGTEIVRYRFAQPVANHFKTGDAENLHKSRHN
jgi:uncharacterized membrane protein YphA (DoxX/SURF4 family)